MKVKPSIGFHGKKYEASFSYTPLVKAKGKVNDTSSETSSKTTTAKQSEVEKEIPSEMRLAGRLLVAPKFFIGTAYGALSEKTSTENIISFEAGFNSSGFQVAGGVNLSTKKNKSETSDKTSSETENGFTIEAVSLDREKQPRFSAAFSYAPTSKKEEGSTTTGSTMLIGAAAQIHF